VQVHGDDRIALTSRQGPQHVADVETCVSRSTVESPTESVALVATRSPLVWRARTPAASALALRQIANSHMRIVPLPLSKRLSDRHARRKVSCTTSSASMSSPHSRRLANASRSARCKT
jgi:hypothetical protein